MGVGVVLGKISMSKAKSKAGKSKGQSDPLIKLSSEKTIGGPHGKQRIAINAETVTMVDEMSRSTGQSFNQIIAKALVAYEDARLDREKKVAGKLRKILWLDSGSGFQIFLDDRDRPWIAFGGKAAERVSFARALHTFARQWGKQVDGSYGQDQDVEKFWDLVADQLEPI